MIRSLVLATACVALFAVSASAQISGEAVRRLDVTAITPQVRAEIASRLSGRLVAPGSMTSTFAVTPDRPVVGSIDAPTLFLSARSAWDWSSAGGDYGARPSITISEWPEGDRYAPAVFLRFRPARGVRYLVLCDMSRRDGANIEVRINHVLTGVTWETGARAAFLIAPDSGDRLNIEISVPRDEDPRSGDIRLTRCEISAIG